MNDWKRPSVRPRLVLQMQGRRMDGRTELACLLGLEGFDCLDCFGIGIGIGICVNLNLNLN